METLTAEKAKQMLLYVADKIIENKPYLTEVDSAIGDGDHGIGMALGFEKVKGKLSGGEAKTVNQVFYMSGRTMLMSMGGASGVIFGSMFSEGSKAVEEKDAFGPEDFAKLFRRSLESIKQRGGASVGDKTMVDALEPAVIALESNASKGLLPMFEAAASAALEGVEKTKDMLAKFGRSKSLMERAIGFQDAGATSVWIIFRSMSEFIQKL
jgi:dihydroxyacetone kinase phosphoprotein-dependent L subunit